MSNLQFPQRQTAVGTVFPPILPTEKFFAFSPKKLLTSGVGCGNIHLALNNSSAPLPNARVVELVDSLASGASARKGVRVRLPPRAPRDILLDVPFLFAKNRRSYRDLRFLLHVFFQLVNQ